MAVSPEDQPFNTLVFEISQLLSQDDHEALMFIYRLPESCRSGSHLKPMIELYRRGHFSPLNLNGLEKVLTTIERHDLAVMVKNYKRNKDPDSCQSPTAVAAAKLHKDADACYKNAKIIAKEMEEIRKELDESSGEAACLSRLSRRIGQLQKRMEEDVVKTVGEVSRSCSELCQVEGYAPCERGKEAACLPMAETRPGLVKSKPTWAVKFGQVLPRDAGEYNFNPALSYAKIA